MARFACMVLIAMAWQTSVADPFVFEFEELAPGVWAGVRNDGPRFPVMGTATFVVGDEGVIVYDGGGVALMAERLMKKISEVSDLPVTHVVISHWHGDHNLGIYRLKEEYPNVQVIGHSFTRAAMLGRPMDYVARYPSGVERLTKQLTEEMETGVDQEGNPLSDAIVPWYEDFFANSELIDVEFKRVQITPPDLTFDESLTIHSGSRVVEIRYLGDANTAGDVVMWLPEERIVATGDIVVKPTPYAFNMPPRRWAKTLRNINALDYRILIPGHGDIQYDSSYVDLLIRTADLIADQTDELVAQGVDLEAIPDMLDFSSVKETFTGGDPYVAEFYAGWFEGPFRLAAVKALSGEPMVTLEREPVAKSEGE